MASAQAWTHHAWGTWLSLQVLPDVRAEAAVRAEPLEKFLIEQGPVLETILQQEEQWARAKVRNYPARPEILAYRFDPQASPAELRRRFLMALRVNPHVPLPLAVQQMPWANPSNPTKRVALSAQEVSLKPSEAGPARQYLALQEGEAVSVLDVLATASDEPDDGLDTGLWLDSGTEHGKLYGFGRQPWGYGAHQDFGEAPFHMGFFHESAATYASSTGLRRALPEYRMHLWQTLARHALVNGHPYWGWRFAGWAMHYAQDMTQPYHVRWLPSSGTVGVLWMNLLDFAGLSAARAQALQRASVRHAWFEQYQQQSLLTPLQKGEWEHPNLKPFSLVLQDAGRMALPERGLREQVAWQAYGRAEALDEAVQAAMPARALGEGDGKAVTDPVPRTPALDALDIMLRDISQHFGNVTRAVWRRLQ